MVAVRISYKKLWMLLLERDIKKASLRHEIGLSAGTWTKLNKGEEVSLSILLRVCDYLNCDNWELPKNSFTAAVTGLILIRDCAVIVVISCVDIRSRTTRSIRDNPIRY